MGDEGFDPTLRPLADVGTTSVTIKGSAKGSKAAQAPSDTDTLAEPAEPESGPQEQPQDSEQQRLIEAGFRLDANGAWTRW